MAYSTGETKARDAANRVHAPVATVTALGAIPLEERVDAMTCLVTADNSNWAFSLASAAADTTSQLVVTPADAPAAGRWIRVDKYCDLKIAFDFNAVDAATLFTVPTGFRLRPSRPLWEITVGFTGGASSAIGVSSTNASYNTKGDLLGGASGDVAAGLTAGFKGTVGAKVAALGTVVLVATDTLRFDRITSVFTAGSGFVHFPVEVIAL